MVVSRYPSACTASIRQDLAGSPSTRIVQAPHTPCSQPACVPFRPIVSRRQSSSVERGSTSTSTVPPLTCNSTRMPASGCLVPGVEDRAARQGGGNALAVGGAGMEVVHRLQLRRGGDNRIAHRRLVEVRSQQRVGYRIEADRHVAGTADADAERGAAAIAVERN